MRNVLIFDLGWKISDVEDLRVDELIYWYEQAVRHQNRMRNV